MEKIKPICCATGFSGGHIIPNLQWAREQQKQNEPILFFSANSDLDNKLLKNNVDYHIPLHLQAPCWYQLPIFIFNFVFSFSKSFYYLNKHKPQVVLSTGSIIALPVCIAAWLLRIPIELFELNATPGQAIKWLAPLANKIHVCFRKTKSCFNEKRCIFSPYPIRFKSKSIRAKIFAPSDRKLIFIQGGSQGSVSLNKKIKALIEDYPEIAHKIAIIHQTGTIDTFDWKQFYNKHKIPAQLFQFDQEIEKYYAEADLIICRSGAGQLFEALYFQKPCITVPLEIPGNNHQVENAQAMANEYPELIWRPKTGTELAASVGQFLENGTLIVHPIKNKEKRSNAEIKRLAEEIMNEYADVFKKLADSPNICSTIFRKRRNKL